MRNLKLFLSLPFFALSSFIFFLCEEVSFSYETGEDIFLGSYPYGSDGERTCIPWTIIEKYADGNAIVIAANALDVMPYNEKNEPSYWESSSIREWLNGKFVQEAFTEEEIQLLEISNIKNNDNAEYGTEGGNDTQDKVFILSIDEAQRLLDKIPEAGLTPYAKAKMLSKKKKSIQQEIWWLRSPGGTQEYAAFVRSDGKIYGGGRAVISKNAGTRPVLRINLNSYAAYKAKKDGLPLPETKSGDVSGVVSEAQPLPTSENAEIPEKTDTVKDDTPAAVENKEKVPSAPDMAETGINNSVNAQPAVVETQPQTPSNEPVANE